jgi:hypothetical protein
MRLPTLLVVLLWCVPVGAQGFTFGGGRDHPYPNEPQYQYPYPYDGAWRKGVRACPRGQALYQGRCRIVRRLDGMR